MAKQMRLRTEIKVSMMQILHTWHQGHYFHARNVKSDHPLDRLTASNPRATLQYSTIMRQRSTFLHDPKLEVDPRQLYLSGDRFVIENLRAAREERLTVGLDELPEEVISFKFIHGGLITDRTNRI